MTRRLLSFPDPVNDNAARTVAAGVVAMAVAFLVTGQGWLLVILAAGFWARVATGPTLSPLGQLATRVVAPRLGPSRPVPGPPKRFAQAIGTVFSSTALVLWFAAGAHVAAMVVVGALTGAAGLEAALGFCLGCKGFALLMRAGIIPAEVCEACADLSLRHPELRRTTAGV
ncbi:MAG: DUF4395 domain-containing protein [Actinomycetota bacterium]|nr:DUF4395 domain-containing protein [Actinomycetota bacterium]